MTLTATARSVPGTHRQDVLIDRRHRITTDEPVSLGGGALGPAPHELLPAALAACISTTLVAYSRTKGWELGEVSVRVDYDNQAAPRVFDVEIRLIGDLSEEQLARLGKVAAKCPLRRSIETGFEFREHVRRTALVPAGSHA